VTDIDVRNDDSRPSLFSGAAAEERQDVSSINTIDELSDAITGSKYIGLWSSNTPEKTREYWLKSEKLFLKHHIPQHRKDRNSSRNALTNLIRRQNHNDEAVERSWFCFSPSQTCVYCFTCRLIQNGRISLLEKESVTGSTLRSHEQSIKHRDGTITFSRRCN